jgi:hypothetical protein
MMATAPNNSTSALQGAEGGSSDAVSRGTVR